jgi:hypothetical protein
LRSPATGRPALIAGGGYGRVMSLAAGLSAGAFT